MSKIRTYKKMSRLESFEERYEYLKLSGEVGSDTFGFDRYLNQVFYHSPEWKRIRRDVILRDDGCDLGIKDRPINGRILIHHLNPITQKDIVDRSDMLMNPNYLICVSHDTHNAIHYGDYSLIDKGLIERKPNDTCPWKV